MQNEAVPSRPGKKKHLLWNIVFIGIAVLTVWVVASNAKGFSLENFRAYLSGNNPWWLSAAFGSMLAYVLLNALMIRLLLRDFGYHRNLWDCTTYTAADLYFSAITPSSTGGQPMEAWYMMQDGVPGVICTVVLLTYLLLYTVSIVLIGLVCLILYPNSFLAFGSFGRILIIIGAAIQLGLSLLYAVLLWNEQLLFRICDWFLRLLKKLHLLRHPDQKREKLRRSMERYSQATHLLAGRRRLLVKALLLNLFHRAAQIMVTVFCFLAGGGSLEMAPKMFAMQSNVVLGACCVPIPGAMGVTDYLMIDGFSSFLNETQSANLELLSRTTSFYICILLCGLIVIVKALIVRFRDRRQS